MVCAMNFVSNDIISHIWNENCNYFIYITRISTQVIQESKNISEFGNPSWTLSLTLLLSWIIVVLCLIKGIKTSGKVN